MMKTKKLVPIKMKNSNPPSKTALKNFNYMGEHKKQSNFQKRNVIL